MFDYLFKYGRGISNTEPCSEGIAPNDEYRIVEAGALADWKLKVPVDSVLNDFRFVKRLAIMHSTGIEPPVDEIFQKG
jgi:hypothetical protein